MAKLNNTRARLAFLGSFVVYLVPVYSVHASLPLGAIIWATIFSGFGDREPLWIAAVLGLAILLQCAAGALIYWLLRAVRWVGVLALLAGCFAIFAAVQFGYLVAIPWVLLTEGERSPETGDWPVACSVPNAEVIASRAMSVAPQQPEPAWLVADGERYVQLAMPGCAVRELAVSAFRTTIDQMIPQGRGLYRASDQNGGPDNLFVLGKDGKPQSLVRPVGATHWRPILADNGTAIAWIEKQRIPSGIGTKWIVRIRDLSDKLERTIDLKMLKPASIEILAFDPQVGRILARRNGKDYVSIDDAGQVTSNADAPDNAIQPTQRFVEVGDGWVSWDIYRDKGRHRIAWSLSAGNGSHEVPLGRGIHDVSVSPGGRLIAVSVGSNVRAGSIKESVYVFRSGNGEEVYRRFFATYHRSLPAFIGTDHLAVTITEDGQSRVDVLIVPPDLR